MEIIECKRVKPTKPSTPLLCLVSRELHELLLKCPHDLLADVVVEEAEVASEIELECRSSMWQSKITLKKYFNLLYSRKVWTKLSKFKSNVSKSGARPRISALDFGESIYVIDTVFEKKRSSTARPCCDDCASKVVAKKACCDDCAKKSSHKKPCCDDCASKRQKTKPCCDDCAEKSRSKKPCCDDCAGKSYRAKQPCCDDCAEKSSHKKPCCDDCASKSLKKKPCCDDCAEKESHSSKKPCCDDCAEKKNTSHSHSHSHSKKPCCYDCAKRGSRKKPSANNNSKTCIIS